MKQSQFVWYTDSVSDDDLEETVTAVLSDIDIQVTANDVDAYHRIAQLDKSKSKIR